MAEMGSPYSITLKPGTVLEDKWIIMELIGTLSPESLPSRRAPWEGFDDVGFRTKVAIIRQ